MSEQSKTVVLIVDDKANNLQYATSILKPYYEIVLANSGQKALTSVMERKPDVILLDIMMPDMSGFEVCTKMKAIPEVKHIPIIFLTAKTAEDDILKAYDLGGVDYITKPFKAKELLARIRAHASLKVQQDRINNLNVELASLNAQKSKLFSVISHDLKNNLGGINSLLEFMIHDLEKNDPPKAKLLNTLSVLNDASQQTMKMLEDLLLWAKNQFNKVSFEPVIVPLKPKGDETMLSLHEQASTKQVHLINNTSDSQMVFADANMLEVMLRNLLNNAIKFSKAQGEVTLSAVDGDGFTCVSITDRGIGMKPGDVEKLFNPASQLTTLGTKGEVGSGLGLQLCQEFINKHGGKIQVESEFGKGSTFSVYFPLKK